MAVSIFDLFKIGIGPSSSHTVGPMRAARRFVLRLKEQNQLEQVHRLKITVYGSLAHTGRGHGTDKAILLGLEGEKPDLIEIDSILPRYRSIIAEQRLMLDAQHKIAFDLKKDLVFDKKKSLPYHPNAMRFCAASHSGATIECRDYYSVGGGFVVNTDTAAKDRIVADTRQLPYAYTSCDELLQVCAQEKMTIAQIMFANEQSWHDEAYIHKHIGTLWTTMKQCIERGCQQTGLLPGGLNLPRRAPTLYRDLSSQSKNGASDPLRVLDWVNLYALAVNEENAAGGRIVTAPTNGAAGIIPAVAKYYEHFSPLANTQGIETFFLSAGAIGILYKENASISGAEVGCQGEVGVACSMAAAGLTAALGGTPAQVENAAEIAMEHNLGLTCDPVGGLVQIPCIERNAMGAVKAINAARMALSGDGDHKVSLDEVIATMHQTGADMKKKYKETSRGGLAVNVIEC